MNLFGRARNEPSVSGVAETEDASGASEAAALQIDPTSLPRQLYLVLYGGNRGGGPPGARGIPYELLLAWRDGRYILISSEDILVELDENLRDPKQAERVVVTPGDITPVTSDPEDDALLATARIAGADYPVTGDKRLLALGEHEGTKIVTPGSSAGLSIRNRPRKVGSGGLSARLPFFLMAGH